MDDDEPECDCEEGAPPWMATFSDLATLLLTFFVLLLSFAEMDVVEFKELLGSVREAFGVQFETVGHHEALSNSPVSIGQEPPGALAAAAADLAEEIRQKLDEAGVGDSLEVEATPDGIVLRVRDRVLFPTGSDELLEDAEPVLAVVAGLASTVATQGLVIEGHTDDRPIHTARFPSNWELSTARATRVLRYFLAHAGLAPGMLSAAGYADTRPLAPNDSAQNRAKNRRVEFLFRRPMTPQEVEASHEQAIVRPRARHRLMPAPREAPEEQAERHARSVRAEEAASEAQAASDAQAAQGSEEREARPATGAGTPDGDGPSGASE